MKKQLQFLALSLLFGWQVKSQTANSLSFDGTGDNVSCGNILTTSYTKEAWVKVTNPALANNIISGGSPSQHAFWASNAYANRLSAGHNGVWNQVQDPTPLVIGTWYHVAVTYDLPTTTMKLYKNGVLVSTNTNVPIYTGASPDVTLGSYAGGNFYGGSIDEVRIWNYARTGVQILSNANCEISAPQAGLIAYYRFNQGVAGGTNTGINTLTNLSGAAGTLNTFALTGATSNWIAGSPVNVQPNVTSSTTNSAVCLGNPTTLNGGGASTYTWTGGVTNGSAFSPTATSNYTVIGTDVNGCINSAVRTITVNSLPVVTSNVTNSVICFGNSTTLNGAGALTYTWTGGVTDGVSFFPSTTSDYTVTGADVNGCSNTSVKSVTVNSLPVVTANATNSVICFGNSTTLNGAGALTYTWTSGVTDGVSFSPSTTSDYTVTGTDANGCNNIATQSIAVNNLPVITVNSGAICSGDSFTMVPSGANTYTYSSGTDIVSPTVNTSYNVTGTDANGCVSSIAAVSDVTVNALPVITVNSGVICSGDSFTIVPNGASTYTYSSGTDIVSPTVNTSYNVTGTDANGCVSSIAAVSDVTVNALPVITVNSGAICSGDSYTMVPSGAVSYTYSSGTDIVSPTVNTSYNVTGTDANGCVSGIAAVSDVTVNALPVITVNSGAICSGDSFTMVPNGAITYTYSSGSDIVSPTVNTSYNVTGTDANGCVSSIAAVSDVTVNALPAITVNSGAICSGDSFTMVPSGASTYSYSGGTDIVSPVADASYSVTGTDANGCVSSIPAISSVTVNAAPTIGAASGAICTGGSFTIIPTGASTYTISGGTDVVSPSTTTSYSVTGTSSLGCVGSNTAVATVSVQTSLSVSITGSNTVCNGQALNLTANGAATYTWNTGAVNNTIAPTPTANATYSVLGSSGTCSSSAVISVTVNPSPTVTAISNSSSLCAGQAATLTASGATTYSWNTGATTAVIAPTPTANTTYTVTGSNGTCSGSALISLTVNPTPSITAVSNTSLLCVGQVAILTASGASSYVWNTSATTASISVSPTVNTTYTVNGTNSNGCTGVTTINQVVTVCSGIKTSTSLNNVLVSVYPNPSYGSYSVELNAASEITVTNALGQVVLVERMDAGKQTLNIQNQTNGIYFLKVMQDGKKQIIKLIKE